MSRRYHYNRMTPDQLSEALDTLKLSMRQFARINGAAERRVELWLAGQEDIPHNVPVMLSLLTLPGAMALAVAVTDTMLVGAGNEA